jgi:mannose-6-phosphate isomerase-like protein (cupin superfamily)
LHVVDTKAIPYKRKGVAVKSITGERFQMVFVRLDPDFSSDHAHDEEQMGFVLTGEVEIVIGSEKIQCTPGDAYHIPAGMRHSFRVISGRHAELLDIFSPPTEENRI